MKSSTCMCKSYMGSLPSPSNYNFSLLNFIASTDDYAMILDVCTMLHYIVQVRVHDQELKMCTRTVSLFVLLLQFLSSTIRGSSES